MNRALTLGVVLVILGVAGYTYGITAAYPGRAFSVTLLMVGLSLVAMRQAFEDGVLDP